MLFVLCVLRILWCAVSILAHPTWQGLDSRGDFMTSLVPANTPIEVIGTNMRGHLSSHRPGEPGNLTALPIQRRGFSAPSLFSLAQNQLWHFRNETTIYPVSVLNSTHLEGVPPLQLVLGKQPAGTVVRGGIWHWRATMLRYELGTSSNNGVFYSCPLGDNNSGIFMFLKPSATPAGCDIITLHSFSGRNAD